jgi:hypothetical protein
MMPRFVLLYHECPPGYARASHWDFMLEVGGALRTWAVARLPAEWHQAALRTRDLYAECAPASNYNEVEAEPLGDHRREYLEYEGPISGDRGHVVRIDYGTYRSIREAPQIWILALRGQLLQGSVELRQTEEGQSDWMLRIHAED